MTRGKVFAASFITILTVLAFLFVWQKPAYAQNGAQCSTTTYGCSCSCQSGYTGSCMCSRSGGSCNLALNDCVRPTDTPAPSTCDWNPSTYSCSGSCGSGKTCKQIAPETCSCESNNPTNTPIPTNTPTPKPTDTPAPNCSCANDGRCVGNVNSCSFAVGYECDYLSSRGLCPGTDNAWVYDRCGNTNCGPPRSPGYYCAYVAGCANPTIAPTTAACQENNQGCGATPVPLDCNYNATGCNLCGVGRVKAIYCGTVS